MFIYNDYCIDTARVSFCVKSAPHKTRECLFVHGINSLHVGAIIHLSKLN